MVFAGSKHPEGSAATRSPKGSVLHIPAPKLPKLTNAEVRRLMRLEKQHLAALFALYESGANDVETVRRSGIKLHLVKAARKEWRLRRALKAEDTTREHMKEVQRASERTAILESPFAPSQVRRRCREERQREEAREKTLRAAQRAAIPAGSIDPTTGVFKPKRRKTEIDRMRKLLRRQYSVEDRVEALVNLAKSENASVAMKAQARIDEILGTGDQQEKFPPMFMLPPDGTISVERVAEVPIEGLVIPGAAVEPLEQDRTLPLSQSAEDEDEESPELTLPASPAHQPETAGTRPVAG